MNPGARRGQQRSGGALLAGGLLALVLVAGPARVRADADAQAAAMLPQFDPAAPMDADTARQALAAVRDERQRQQARWAREGFDCYQKFLLNRCLANLKEERIAIERRLNAIQVGAQQSLREDAALRRNEREAQRLAAETANRDSDEQVRAANRRAWEERQAAARASEQRRRDEAARRAPAAPVSPPKPPS
jgi:hypothetical protein